MLARLQKVITLAILALALAWAASWLVHGRPVLGAAGGGFIIFCHSPVMALEMLLLRLTHGKDPAPRAYSWELVWAWLWEVVMAVRVFYWRQPFRSRILPDALRRGDDTHHRGVLLVHGFLCNRGFWNPWLRRLTREGVPFIAINLEPVFAPIEAHASRIEEAVRRLKAATGEEAPVIVAHSMGGLAVRAWLRQRPGRDAVHRVVTIASPHQGTWLARFGQTPNTRQMRLRGPWLTGMARDEAAGLYDRFTCFYSNCDNVVFPPSVATLPGADNRFIPGRAHVQLAFHPMVIEEVIGLSTLPPAAHPAASGPAPCSRTRP